MTRAPRPALLLLLLALSAGPALAQSSSEAAETKTGYMVIDHQVYEKPLGEPSGVVKEGEHVRAEPVPGQRGWYEVARLDGGAEAKIGYVVEPFIWDGPAEQPLAAGGDEDDGNGGDGGDGGDVLPASTPPVLSARSESVSGEGEVRYTHEYTNVRATPSVDGEIVAQLPPGAEVEVGTVAHNWASVLRGGTELGHVWLPLLEEAPPSEEQTTMVYITRTGEKYHREGCRHLRSSKFARTLEEALDENYEACKVCRPPKPDEEL